MDNRLLAVRRTLKRKTPHFVRQDAHKKPKLGYAWRKPKGSDSKMRRKERGYRRSVEVGFRSPRLVRGLSRHGLKKVIVNNVEMLRNLGKEHIIEIASQVSMKNRIAIIKEAMKLQLRLSQHKNPAASLAAREKAFQERLARKRSRVEKKKPVERKKEKEGKPEEKKDELAQKIEAEEMKKQEKKDFDKLLTTTS